MAQPNKLVIKYHPAEGKISFKVLEGDNPIDKNYEKLQKYELKENFILSLQGNEFFDDILTPFIGKSSIDVEIKTTRLDYEDFKNQVCEYNKSSKTKINLKELTDSCELLSMKDSYEKIKELGISFSKLLEEYEINIGNIQCNASSSRECINKAVDKIKEEYEKIINELNILSADNNVNICLAGSYSSGKSTLINSLLGYKILPVALAETTAKMVKIQGVEKKEDVKIIFTKNDNEQKCKVIWNNNEQTLQIDECTFNIDYINKLKQKIEEKKDLRIDEQINNFLTFINTETEIDAKIELYFPLALNNNIKYTIYDTPGVGGLCFYNKNILLEALNSQVNSILLFILKPGDISGTPNGELIQELLTDNCKKNISLDNSFFVINKADSIQSDIGEIYKIPLKASTEEDISLDLGERKLLFISGGFSFATMLKKNNVASSTEDNIFEDDKGKIKRNSYYKFNRLGKSAFETDRLLEYTDEKLETTNDLYDQLLIHSGYESLKIAINQYAERYAPTVKTSTLIGSIKSSVKSVEKLLKDTMIDTSGKRKGKEENLEYETNKIKEFLTETKNDCDAKFKIDCLLKEVEVDSDSFFSNLSTPIIEDVDSSLEKKLEYLMGVKIDLEEKEYIKSIINNKYKLYKDNYEIKRKDLLNDISSYFINTFIKKIEGSDISKETRERITNITNPNVAEPNLKDSIDKEIMKVLDESFKSLKKVVEISTKIKGKISDLGETIDENIHVKFVKEKIKERTDTISEKWGNSKIRRNLNDKVETIKESKVGQICGRFFGGIASRLNDSIEIVSSSVDDIINDKVATKKELISNIRDALYKEQENITNNFKEDLSKALENLLTDLEKEFNDNISNYSSTIKALNEDIQPLIELSEQIKELSEKVNIEHQNLIRVIGE